MTQFRHVTTCVLLSVLLATVGCSKGNTKTEKKSDSPMVLASSMVPGVDGKNSALITFKKSEIFNRTFLYGSDLQYSSYTDAGYDLYLQSMAVGHMQAQFKKAANKLQLVIDQSIYFESDINHPDRLVYDFPVVAEDGNMIQVLVQRSSPLTITMVSNQAERNSWVRSAEFVKEGNYLMLETTVEDSTGNQYAFMESLFPRETIVPADAKPILADADREDLADRYRFLGAGKVFMNLDGKRVQTEAASRFNVVPEVTIDWYVTPNIPAEYIPAVKAGIEGWNRYSQAMWNADMVRFAGVLPDGVKIGDPRYNIVNWDSVAEAGAAYESQATDPLTGIQSHSLIYLPNAWVNIGRDYWSKGGFSDAHLKATEMAEKALSSRKDLLGRKLHTACIHDAAMMVSPLAKTDPETFAIELLKGVLFHEVGHALGLAHNFKGSLSWDSTDNTTAFATSIMDYNQYQIERGAFESPSSSNGPLLEYDRQVLVALYDQAKDLDKAPKVAACNDDETDSEEDGVDPLCIRYDAGKDPTAQLIRVKSLVTDADVTFGGQQSLAKAIASVSTELGNAAVIKTEAEFKDKMDSLAKTVTGLTDYYLTGGAQSLRYMTTANLRSLKLFKKEVLPEGYSEAEMRERAWNVLEFASKMEQLPKPAQDAISKLIADTQTWAKTTAYAATLPQSGREATLAKLMESFSGVQKSIESAKDTGIITKMRKRLFSAMAQTDAPFNFDKNGVDYEAKVPALLAEVFMTKANGETRSQAERLTLLKVLSTFKEAAGVSVARAKIQTALEAELAAAQDTRTRTEVRDLLNAL